MTVLPVESLDLGPEGPTRMGSFSSEVSSRGVRGATRGSGVHSSTSSSISLNGGRGEVSRGYCGGRGEKDVRLR